MKTCFSAGKLMKQFGNTPFLKEPPISGKFFNEPPLCPNFKNQKPPPLILGGGEETMKVNVFCYIINFFF